MKKEPARRGAAQPRAAKVGEPKQRRKSPERTLNRQTVVAAALEEIDRAGLETFSVRNVAKRLGVYPTAVAWHAASRGQLLADVVTLALADVRPTGFHETWQSYLRQTFHRYREAIRRHPNVAPLIGTQLLANPAVELEFIEGLLATLHHAGFSGTRLVAAYNAVIAAVVGFTTQEFAPIPSEGTGAWQKEIRERLAGVQRTRYPLLADNM
ncbi:MAG: TetR/AcrR family transcriptional regulator C-terminal domain-containing protein, partial [Gammaproteobacteria bacterium]